MKPEFIAAISAALLSLALPTAAQTTRDAADPKAATPSVQYRSVFRETSLGIEKEKTDWRQANDDVGKFTRGHVDIIKQEEMDDKKSMDSKPIPPNPVIVPKPAPHKH